ncbi:MAG: thymidylate kinase [Planctomycetota bacterium]|jgi:thymidylate kinase
MSDSKKSFAPMIAIVGCDGSGKSTVSEEILKWVSRYGPAESAHLGKQSGNMGRSLMRLPLVGKWIEGLIGRKLKSVQSSKAKNQTPKMLPALVMYGFTIRRVRRFRRMLKLRDKGMIVITDRFPQLDHPKSFDGPALDVNAEGNGIVRWLARRERAAFEWMTSHHPDLVIRLNVDVETAFARKPDHRKEALRKKIEVAPLLKFKGSPIVDIDTVQPLAQVLDEARAAVTNIFETRGYAQPSDAPSA